MSCLVYITSKPLYELSVLFVKAVCVSKNNEETFFVLSLFSVDSLLYYSLRNPITQTPLSSDFSMVA